MINRAVRGIKGATSHNHTPLLPTSGRTKPPSDSSSSLLGVWFADFRAQSQARSQTRFGLLPPSLAHSLQSDRCWRRRVKMALKLSLCLTLLGFVLVWAWQRPSQPGKEIIDSQAGNVVRVSVYMEAQCPDTSRFVKKHLVPTWQRLRGTGRVEFTVVPFGKARCERFGNDDDFKCDCQHGKDECELNQLMNCAINDLTYADHYMPLIGCIQGTDNVEIAVAKCLSSGPVAAYSKRLRECALGPRGRRLLALAGQKTTALSPALTFVPWVMLENERVVDAFYALEENVCSRLQPKPDECQPVAAAARARA